MGVDTHLNSLLTRSFTIPEYLKNKFRSVDLVKASKFVFLDVLKMLVIIMRNIHVTRLLRALKSIAGHRNTVIFRMILNVCIMDVDGTGIID